MPRKAWPWGRQAVAGRGWWQWRAGAGGSGGPASAKKFAQHAPSNTPPAKKFSQHAPSNTPPAKKFALQA